MFTQRILSAISMLWLTSLAFSLPCLSASGQTVTEPQLQTLLPDDTDLPGFLRIAPAGENLLADGSHSLVTPLHDQFWLPYPATKSTRIDQTTGINTAVYPDHSLAGLRRVLYSSDGRYFVEIRLELCATPEAAQQQLQKFTLDSSGVFQRGTFTRLSVIGDETLFLPADFYGSSLIFRAGNVFALVSGHQSAGSTRSSGQHLVFPTEAIEAIASQMLLKASQQPELTGVSVQQARVDINGHALPKNALLVAGQTYVPVAEFAKAMGLTSRWDAKTGALTLSGAGHKTVALTAGSTAAIVGGAKAAALTVPVLKQAGEPVMTLADLLAVTGGRIVGHSGNTVQVKG